jgi:hypothetical protein
MIHGEPQAAQDERRRLCEIVIEKYNTKQHNPKKYILKVFGSKGITYYNGTNGRVSDVNEASKIEIKLATSLQKQIKVKTEIVPV